jgi:excisionase family DNA binding protein
MLHEVEDRQLSLAHIGRLLRIAEAAAVLGMTEKALRHAISRGQIGVIHIGKRARIPENEIFRITAAGWRPAERK